jgi:hypothetical protein
MSPETAWPNSVAIDIRSRAARRQTSLGAINRIFMQISNLFFSIAIRHGKRRWSFV